LDTSEQKKQLEFHPEKYVGFGAMFASFLAALSVIDYLLHQAVVAGDIRCYLRCIVIGKYFGMESLSSEALFVVVSRFLVVFGIMWFASTAVLVLISAIVYFSRKRKATHQ